MKLTGTPACRAPSSPSKPARQQLIATLAPLMVAPWRPAPSTQNGGLRPPQYALEMNVGLAASNGRARRGAPGSPPGVQPKGWPWDHAPAAGQPQRGIFSGARRGRQMSSRGSFHGEIRRPREARGIRVWSREIPLDQVPRESPPEARRKDRVGKELGADAVRKLLFLFANTPAEDALFKRHEDASRA